MKQVFTKARNRRGLVYPAQPTKYAIDINKSKDLIAIYEEGKCTARFNLGDLAEYNSYNLSYLGKIIQITESTVTIEEPHNMYGENHGRRHRLNMNEFCWRNSGFDLAKTIKRNQEESYYI
jgi:hypothetical protein